MRNSRAPHADENYVAGAAIPDTLLGGVSGKEENIAVISIAWKWVELLSCG